MTFDFEQPVVEISSRIENLKNELQKTGNLNLLEQIDILEKTKKQLMEEIYSCLTPWQKVQIARHPQRPYSLDYIKKIFTNFTELRGDRFFSDDQALICGIAEFDRKSIAIIGHQKGRTIQENMERNFGMPHPEGYRKALRIMKLAEKFKKPIITFIDTAGAYPGIAAEERGQAEAIARNLREMSAIKVPIITIVIGEGGSGGALGIGISNKVLCLENSYYSVISPEGCAAILFRDASKASQAAYDLKLTAKDLLDLKIIDEIIKEPLGGAHRDVDKTSQDIKLALIKYIRKYNKMKAEDIISDRYLKFRNIGVYNDSAKNSAKNSKKTSTDSPHKNTEKTKK
ncbi:MAG: acetyl-CoA carboxylase carboxyltransferase subunit alpha [Elusimicrobiota bacterium]|jgi:acetyl-CoA carboxylase carboxyl transferase subunit alpha|nr:acetyl-CoA carboxylase carboxyltransferase subunit alpha [Elusimicrobiota bacterium]